MHSTSGGTIASSQNCSIFMRAILTDRRAASTAGRVVRPHREAGLRREDARRLADVEAQRLGHFLQLVAVAHHARDGEMQVRPARHPGAARVADQLARLYALAALPPHTTAYAVHLAC